MMERSLGVRYDGEELRVMYDGEEFVVGYDGEEFGGKVRWRRACGRV